MPNNFRNMGNCSMKGNTDVVKGKNLIRIMRDSGEILEFKGPKIVGDIVTAFPGYRIFIQGQINNPLLNDVKLVEGHFYYLLPSRSREIAGTATDDLITRLSSGSGLQVLASPGNGVWRVKLAINSRTLEEILAEEVNTKILIDKMRMAANSRTLIPTRVKPPWASGVNCKPTLTNVF